nr:transposase [Levilactobacillus enshiensis]
MLTNQRAALNSILDHGEFYLGNNAAKRNIKRMVIGRKNSMFSTSQVRAEATAIWMTLIVSAKVSGSARKEIRAGNLFTMELYA